ncbi:MAG: sodium:solute symporter family transporter [Thermoguttaceae bacterium]
MLKLTVLDFVIVVLYLGALWSIGLFVAYRHRREDESFLLNRHFGWLNIGCSIFATNIGPPFLLSSAAAAYSYGMVTASFEWLAWIFLFLLAIFFAPHYIRMRISTMPEFIRRRFGRHAAEFLSWYGLLTIIVLWIGGDMFVGSRLLNQILGVPEWQCLVGLAVIFTSFTVAGGFAAVMATDTFQAMLMIVSMLTLNVIAFWHVGSLDKLIHGIPREYWTLVRPANDPNYPWPAIFLGYPVLGFWFWCTDQTIVQRMLGARDLRQAQLGAAFTAFLKILPPFLFMMPGIFCLVLEPKLGNADEAFLTMLSHYMPIGMLGLMISVLGAASVAGVSGGLNAFSTIFTMDIYRRKFCPEASPRHLKRVGQLVVVSVATAAVGAALFLQHSEKNIFDTLQIVIAYFAPPVASVFLAGILWQRATAKGAVTTLYLGSAVSLSIGVLDFLGLPYKGFWPHFMLMTVILFLGCCALLVITSLLTRKSPYEEDFKTPKEEEKPQKTSPLVWMLFGMLAVVMSALYGIFN